MDLKGLCSGEDCGVYGVLDWENGGMLDTGLNSSVGVWNGNGAKNMNSRGLASKVSVGNIASISNWAGGRLCAILAKNPASFCLYPENVNRVEPKKKPDWLVGRGNFERHDVQLVPKQQL